jgi:sulfite exporter TauE/SafE
MFLFGIGNAPALIAVILAKTRGSLLFRKGLSKFSLVIMLTVGTILVFRSLETTHKHGDSQHADQP